MGIILAIVLFVASSPAARSQDRLEDLRPASWDSVSAIRGVDGADHPAFLRTALYTTGVIGITAGLIRYDQQTYNVLERWRRHSSPIERVSPLITNLGDGTLSLGLFGGYLSYGLIFKSNEAVGVGKIGLESFIVSGVAVQILKFAFGREQPNVATKPGGKWNGPLSYFRRSRSSLLGIGSFDAFPSGHTASIFAAASTLADAYDTPWISYTSYSVASGVAISRIMERTHWLSDCFVGGVIGVLSTKAVEKLNTLQLSASIAPLNSGKSVGVRLVLVH